MPGHYLYLCSCPGPPPLFGWLSEANSLIWLVVRDHLLDLEARHKYLSKLTYWCDILFIYTCPRSTQRLALRRPRLEMFASRFLSISLSPESSSMPEGWRRATRHLWSITCTATQKTSANTRYCCATIFMLVCLQCKQSNRSSVFRPKVFVNYTYNVHK